MVGLRNKKWFGIGLGVFGAFLMFASSVITPLTAHAGMFDGWYSNGGVSEGFFSNNGWSDTLGGNRSRCGGPGWTESRCPVLPNDNYSRDALNAGYYRGGNASKPASIQRAKSLVADLKSFYYSPQWGYEAWYQTGASFIVNTMLGYTIDSPQKSRWLSASMWNDVEQRLIARASAGRINWNIDIRGGEKDTYTRVIRNADGVWRYDVVYDYEPQIKNGIEIYNDDGSIAYQIWYSCANPIGDVAGLQPVDFRLNPTISVTPTISEGASANPVTVTPIINNGGTTASTPADWQITTFTLNPGVPTPTAAQNNTTPTSYYGNGATVWSSGNQAFSRGNTALGPLNQAIPDKPVGTKICYALSVQPYTQADGRWNHSTPACVTIAKSPKTQVLGGDLTVGRGQASPGVSVRTTVTQKQTTSKMYGSWAEYGIIPSGTIVGMASASGYGGGAALNTPLCSVSLLSFVNTGASGCSDTAIGKYSLGTGVAASIAGRFPVTATTPKLTKDGTGRVNLNSLATGTTYTNAAADTTLTLKAAANIPGGKWFVINAPNATVVIDGNITYTPAQLSSAADIPQVIIIAKNIILSDNVSQVDAWLIATGTGAEGRINTCGAGGVTEATLPNAKQCTTSLQINGPVMANHLYLRRTAGAGTGAQAGDPAEIFNLRPDAYLWASNLQRASSKATTVMTTEMPPRF